MRRLLSWVLLAGVVAGCGGPAGPAFTPDGANLAEPGPYGVGKVLFNSVDGSRDDRGTSFTAWYPADNPEEKPATRAPADRRGAPYPVVVGSTNMLTQLGSHLASHGYVVVGSGGELTGWDATFLDLVRDRVFALDELERIDDGPLEGLADTARTGVIDYSFGAGLALALAGARIDPDSYRDSCAAAGEEPPFDPSLIGGSSGVGWGMIREYYCLGANDWDAFAGYADRLGVATEQGLWKSMADGRVLAVIAGGPEGRWLFGEEGLAAATVPVLLFAGSLDDINVYDFETRFLFEHLGSPVELITFVGADHMLIFDPRALEQIERFATAYFGLHVKGDDRYGEFVTPVFVEEVAPTLVPASGAFETLLWGLAGD